MIQGLFEVVTCLSGLLPPGIVGPVVLGGSTAVPERG